MACREGLRGGQGMRHFHHLLIHRFAISTQACSFEQAMFILSSLSIGYQMGLDPESEGEACGLWLAVDTRCVVGELQRCPTVRPWDGEAKGEAGVKGEQGEVGRGGKGKGGRGHVKGEEGKGEAAEKGADSGRGLP